MKPITCQTDSALMFNAQDAYLAIAANPDNPKVPQFFNERQACLAELDRRTRLRDLRKRVKWEFDPLAYPIKRRQRIAANRDSFFFKQSRDAQFTLAILRRN